MHPMSNYIERKIVKKIYCHKKIEVSCIQLNRFQHTKSSVVKKSSDSSISDSEIGEMGRPSMSV